MVELVRIKGPVDPGFFIHTNSYKLFSLLLTNSFRNTLVSNYKIILEFLVKFLNKT